MFKIGQNVVCTDDSKFAGFVNGERIPISGHLYTIRDVVLGGACVRLLEIINDPHKYEQGLVECSFKATRFLAVRGKKQMPKFTVQPIEPIVPPVTPPAGPSIVQQKLSTSYTYNGVDDIILSFDAGIAAGSIIVAAGYTAAGDYNLATAGGQTDTDSGIGVVSDGNSMQSWISAILAPAAGQIDVHLSHSIPAAGQFIIFEVAGYASPTWDRTASAGGTSTTASSGATAALTQAAEFVIGVATAQDDVFTGIGAGSFTDDGGENTGFFNQQFGHKIVAATTAVSFAPTVNSASLFRSSVATVKG